MRSVCAAPGISAHRKRDGSLSLMAWPATTSWAAPAFCSTCGDRPARCVKTHCAPALPEERRTMDLQMRKRVTFGAGLCAALTAGCLLGATPARAQGYTPIYALEFG